MKLSKDEMKNILGGSDQQPPTDNCNGGCATDAGCDSVCPHCLVNGNWGDQKMCFKATS